MQVYLDTPILGLDGVPIESSQLADGRSGTITVGRVLVHALLIDFPDERDSTDKLQRFELALQIRARQGYDFTFEEISLLRSRVARAFSTLITGQVLKLLDGKDSGIKLQDRTLELPFPVSGESH